MPPKKPAKETVKPAASVQKKLDRRVEKYRALIQEAAEVSTELEPLRVQLEELDEQILNVRQEVLDIMIDEELTDARVFAAEAMLECMPPRISVEVLDVDKVPEEYVRIKKEVDKVAVKAYFEKTKGKKNVPGTQVVEGEPSIRITI